MIAVAHALLGLAFVVAAGGWGWTLLTACGRVPSRDPDRLAIYPLAGLALFALLGSILWMTGGFRAELAWTLTALGLVFAMGWARAEGIRASFAEFRAAGDARTRRVAVAVWGVALALGVPVVLAPDTSWDSCTYHLVYARDVARLGYFPLVPDHELIVHWFTTQTLVGWGYLLAGIELDVAGRVILATTASLGVVVATRRVGRAVHPRVGLLALVLVLSTPLWLIQWGSALVDFSTFALGAVGLSLAGLACRERRWRVLGLVLLAVAAASKHWGALVPVSLAALWVVDAVRQRSWRPCLRAVALGLLCVAFVTPWLIKNQLLFGDPLATDVAEHNPELARELRLYFDGEPPPVSVHPETRDFGLRFVFVTLAQLASGRPWSGALSPLLALGILSAALAFRRRWWRTVWLGAVISFAMYVAVLPGNSSSAPTRYFFNLAPWAYLLAALGWHRWCGDVPRRAVVLWCLVIVTSLPVLTLVGVRCARKVPVVTGIDTTAEYWARSDPAAPLIETANRLMTPEDRIFVVGERVLLLKAKREQIVRRYQANWAGVHSAETLAGAWDRWGITYVLVDTPDLWQGCLEDSWVLGDDPPALRGWECIQENEGRRLYRRAHDAQAAR